jgi:hypothetical protein
MTEGVLLEQSLRPSRSVRLTTSCAKCGRRPSGRPTAINSPPPICRHRKVDRLSRQQRSGCHHRGVMASKLKAAARAPHSPCRVTAWRTWVKAFNSFATKHQRLVRAPRGGMRGPVRRQLCRPPRRSGYAESATCARRSGTLCEALPYVAGITQRYELLDSSCNACDNGYRAHRASRGPTLQILLSDPPLPLLLRPSLSTLSSRKS